LVAREAGVRVADARVAARAGRMVRSEERRVGKEGSAATGRDDTDLVRLTDRQVVEGVRAARRRLLQADRIAGNVEELDAGRSRAVAAVVALVPVVVDERVHRVSLQWRDVEVGGLVAREAGVRVADARVAARAGRMV